MKKSKKGIYVFIILLLLICIGACSFFVYYFYNFRNDIIKVKNVNVTRKIDVTKNVKLINNEFFDFNQVSNEYLAKLLDKVEINFTYNYSFNKYMYGKYKYYVLGTLKNEDNTFNTTIYKSDEKNGEINGNIINFGDSFIIDVIDSFKKYEDFKNEYKIETDTFIEFNVYINYDVESNYLEDNVIKNDVITVRIPINEDKTSINIKGNVQDNYKVYSKLSKKDKNLSYIICLEFLCAIILFALIILLIYKKMINLVGIYDRTLDDILNNYSEQIVYLSGIPNLDDYNMLFVQTFEDIIDAAANSHVPINYVNIINHRECVFIVFKDNNAYVYKLNEKIIKKERD